MRQNYARIEDADICFCVIWLPLSESHFYRGDWALGRAPYQVVRLFKARGATYILLYQISSPALLVANQACTETQLNCQNIMTWVVDGTAEVEITTDFWRRPNENLFQPVRKKSFYYRKAGQEVLAYSNFSSLIWWINTTHCTKIEVFH